MPAEPTVDWVVPAPRPAWRGAVDRFIGPGATRGEILLQAIGTPVLAGALLWLTWRTPTSLDAAGVVVLVLFAVDGAGGVLTNSTGTAKRWYHRPGTRPERLGFVTLHLVHVALLAWLVMADLQWFVVTGTVLLLGAIVIEWAPPDLKRPVAAGLLVLAVVTVGHVAPSPPGLQWVPLVLLAKLLVAHLVPEAPFRRGPDAAADVGRARSG